MKKRELMIKFRAFLIQTSIKYIGLWVVAVEPAISPTTRSESRLHVSAENVNIRPSKLL